MVNCLFRLRANLFLSLYMGPRKFVIFGESGGCWRPTLSSSVLCALLTDAIVYPCYTLGIGFLFCY